MMSFKFCSAHIDRNFNLIQQAVDSTESELQKYLHLIIEELKSQSDINQTIINLKKCSVMSICNYSHKNHPDNSVSILFMYLTFKETQYGYLVLGANWLNYIGISASILDDTHNFITKLKELTDVQKSNHNKQTKDTNSTNVLWKKVSTASLFKAFEPLVNFIPKPLRNRTNNSRNLYNVMSVISTNKEEYTKDYVRNFFSKIITNLKDDFNILNTNKSKASITEVITNNEKGIGTLVLYTELTKPTYNTVINSNVFLEDLFTLYEQSLKNQV